MADTDLELPEENSFATQQILLTEQLYQLLEGLHPLLKADIITALKGPGKLLFQVPPSNPHKSALPAGVFALLPFFVALSVDSGIDPIVAGRVAVANECVLCALDLLDDVEDEDQSSTLQQLGVPRALNVSTALLMLAQKAILSLQQHGVPYERVLALLQTLQNAILTATEGQHQDILTEGRQAQDLTREECIAIAASKAGSLMQLSCRLGAICAGATENVYKQFSELGELLGIAHQLDNDSHDLYYLLQDASSGGSKANGENTIKSTKTDLRRGKKTLPVVLATTTLQQDVLLTDEERERSYQQALKEGIITTWGISLLYRERARESLRSIESSLSLHPALYLLLGL